MVFPISRSGRVGTLEPSQAWLDKGLQELDVTTWVKENMEAVDNIQDRITLKQILTLDKRKRRLDKQALERTLKVEVRVLLRTPCLDAKLTNAWEGPYTISNC